MTWTSDMMLWSSSGVALGLVSIYFLIRALDRDRTEARDLDDWFVICVMVLVSGGLGVVLGPIIVLPLGAAWFNHGRKGGQ